MDYSCKSKRLSVLYFFSQPHIFVYSSYNHSHEIATNIKDREVLLLYTISTSQLNLNEYKFYLNLLPDTFQKEVLKYRKWQDQYNCLFGKLLVSIGYNLLTGKKLDFNLYQRDEFNKPYIQQWDKKMNISHSHHITMCVFANDTIGVDVEALKKIDPLMFKNIYSETEMNDIQKKGLSEFYKYWTSKEATAKALGKGLAIPFDKLTIYKNSSVYQGEKWFLHNFIINKYYSTIASRFRVKNVISKCIKF